MLVGKSFRTWTNVFLLLILYVCLGYYISREDSTRLMLLYGCSCGLTFVLLKHCSLSTIFWLGLLFRFIFIPAIPWLSQDFYRFIWDGLLLQNEMNPYAFSPNELMGESSLFNPHLKNTLFDGMGELSAQHYSNYPPINQFGFLFSVTGFQEHLLGAVISMRSLLILADVGLFFVAKKILEDLNLPQKRIGWYFLNPLVIIELTGNLHWEGVMLFFFALGWWLLIKQQNILATIAFTFSIATKLIPLLLLPVFARFQSLKKTIGMSLLGAGCLLVLFVPFFKNIGVENYLGTIQLWFKNFEFNGSLYYLIRWVGYQVKGYNIIRQWGEVSPLIIMGIVLIFAFFKSKKKPQEVFTAMLFLMTIYYLMASIVHPWYIISLVFLCLFTRFSFPLLWSMVIVVSYVTYADPNFKENYGLIAVEYSIVIFAILYELRQKKNLLQHF